MSENPIFFSNSMALQPAKNFFSESPEYEQNQNEFLFGDKSFADTEKYIPNALIDEEQDIHSLSFHDDPRQNLDDSNFNISNPFIGNYYADDEEKVFEDPILCPEINAEEIIEEVLLKKQLSKLPSIFKEISSDSQAPPKIHEPLRKPIRRSRTTKAKSKNEDKKNIHRYMIRQVIRSLASGDFEKKVREMCIKNGSQYEEVKQYYLGQIENFTSIQLLSEHWSVDPLDPSSENRRRMVFREFSKWFLKERAIRYILAGKMKNPEKYIHYKNHIMLYFVDRPHEYKSNNK